MMNAEDLLTVRLQAQQWNLVLAILSDAPFKISAPLIDGMQKQLAAQAQAPHMQLTGEEAAQALNGELRARLDRGQ